jgi:CheY-like chemotaxis protein
MAGPASTGGLKWVRDELLTNLARIGAQMSAGGDMADAVSLLFEMRAVLIALPLPAASLVAEEMQRTCEQVLKGATTDEDQARETVALAAVRLGEHLRQSDIGGHQDPLALLGSINALRHARRVAPMSAAELLVPSSVLAQSEQVSPDSLSALVRLARKVRPHFHRYLVRWFNGDNAHEGLLGLSRLFHHMRRYFKQGPAHELFLAAEAVIEGLLDGHLDPDAPTKALVGRIDKVLKPLTAPRPEWPADLVSALNGDLLARLSQMPADAPAVQQLERLYGQRLTDDTEPGTDDPDLAHVGDILRALREADGGLAACAEPPAPPPSRATQHLESTDREAAATLQESRLILASTRNAIGNDATKPIQTKQLADTRRTLKDSAATLRDVGEAEPARLLDALAEQLRVRYLDPNQVPGAAGVELIARALAAVEMYLQDWLELDARDMRMIAEADYAIERLSGLLRPDQQADVELEDTESLSWSETSQTVHLELLDLFLDEAQDELEAIRIRHERWCEDRNDHAALALLRNSFQALKNSGGLVGARHLADLARHTAAVLKRLLDRQLAADVEVANFVADTIALLPEIIDAESQRRPAPIDDLVRTSVALLAAANPQRGGRVLAPRPDAAAEERADPPVAAPAATVESHETEPPSACPAAAAADTGVAAGVEAVDTVRARLVQQNARLGFRLAQLEDGLTRVAHHLNALAAGDTEAGPEPTAEVVDKAALRRASALLEGSRTTAAAIGDLQRDSAHLLCQLMGAAESLPNDLRGARMRQLTGGTPLPDGPIADDERRTVVVVDSSQTLRQVGQGLLAREQMAVISVRDGVEAQVILRSRAPDLLLINLEMPRKSGLELARWVRDREELRRLPIIVVTSMAGDAQCGEVLACGADRVIERPFAEDELLDQIESLLLYAGDCRDAFPPAKPAPA